MDAIQFFGAGRMTAEKFYIEYQCIMLNRARGLLQQHETETLIQELVWKFQAHNNMTRWKDKPLALPASRDENRQS